MKGEINLFEKHKQRADKVRQRISANKIFLIGAAIIVVILLGRAAEKRKQPDAAEFRHPEGYELESQTESTDIQLETETPHWRFYWSDLIILGGGSAFCGFMIVRERRKAREEL